MVEPRGPRERSVETQEEDAMVQRILEMRRKDCELLEQNILEELVREKWQQLKPLSKETDAKEQFIILLQLCFQRAADETLSVKKRRVAIESIKSLLEKLESHVAVKRKNRREEEEDEGISRQSSGDSPVPSVVEGIPQPTAKPPSAVHQPKPKRSNAVEPSNRTTAPPQLGWSQTNQIRASAPSNVFYQPSRNVHENVDRHPSKQNGSSLAASSSISQNNSSQPLSVGRIDRTTDSSQPLSALQNGDSSMPIAATSRRISRFDMEPLPLSNLQNTDGNSSLSAASTSQTDFEPLPFSVLPQQNGNSSMFSSTRISQSDLEPIPLSALPQSNVPMSGRLAGMPHGNTFQRQNGNFSAPNASYASMARIGWSAAPNNMQHVGRGLHPRMPFPVRPPPPMQPPRNNPVRSPVPENATSPSAYDNRTLTASTTLPAASSAHSHGQPTASEHVVPATASNNTSTTESTMLVTATEPPADKGTQERLSALAKTNVPAMASELPSQENPQEILPPAANTNAFVAASTPSATGANEKPLVQLFMETLEKNTTPKVQTIHFPPDLGVPIGQKLKTRSGLLETRINSLKITCHPKPITKVMTQIIDRRIREWEPYRNPFAYVAMGLTSAVETCLPEGNFARTAFSTQIDLSKAKFHNAGKYPITLANYPGMHWGTKVENNLELSLVMFPLKRNEKDQSKRADGHLWPKGSFLVVQNNPQELQQRRQESHDPRLWKGCSAPLDLVPLIKDPKRPIKIDLCSYDEDSYFYCVMLCSIQTPDALYRQLTEPGPFALERINRGQAMELAANIARRQVVQLDCDDDAEKEKGKLIFSLLCPLSKTVMETPVRSSKCNHWQCFDLKFFLETNQYISGARWRCGACDPRFVSPRELRICGLTADMIREYKDEISALRNRVELSEDGAYRLLEEKKVRHRGVKRAPSADGNEVKPKRNPIEEAIIID